MISINFLQVVSLFRKYWKEILIIVLCTLVIGKMRVDYNKLEDTYEATQQELENQISQLNKIHAEEISRKNKVLAVYKSAMENLEKDFEDQKKKNKQISKERKATLEKQFSQNKEVLADEIGNTFGLKYVP